MSHRIRLAALAAAASALVSTSAVAQEFELHRWSPSTSMRHGFITLDDGRADLGRGYELGLWLHYMDDPLVATLAEEQIGKFVTGQLAAHIVGSFEIADRFRMGVELPAYLVQSTEDDVALLGRDVSGGGVGDLTLTPKVELFDGRADDDAGVALSLLVPVLLPTGDGDRFQGEGFRARPTVALDWANARGLQVGTNLGVTLREQTSAANLDVDEEFNWGVGLTVPLGSSPLQMVYEVDGALPLSGGVSSEEMPIDLMAMLRAGLDDVVLGVGGGAGVNEGWGAPDYRLFAMVGWAPGPKADPTPAPAQVILPSDRDGDGYLDPDDGCPDEPEDFDGWVDEDGCPDPDNDEDGILDGPDECPAVDGDVMAEVREDHDGWLDEDGCPEPDNDEDRILDVDDACPGVDGEALVDIQEVYNDFEDEDGCPDVLAEVTETHIQINGIIYFDLDSDVIQSRSMPVIDEVARLLDVHSELLLVEVAGHTDVRASEDYNEDLSQRRTESVVRALVARGVDEDRLRAVGYGESELADRGTTEAAHQRNRRVEFRIIERAEAPEGEQ